MKFVVPVTFLILSSFPLLGDQKDFILACQSEDIGTISTLLDKGSKVNEAVDGLDSPLFIAARENRHPAVIRLLIARGADLNYRNGLGQTAFLAAANENPEPEVIAVLASAGADIHAKSINGWGALSWAAMLNENPEVFRKLVALGLSANETDLEGTSPLMRAAQTNSTQVFRTLLQLGANLQAIDSHGKTVRDYAVTRTGRPRQDILSVIEERSKSSQESTH